MKDNSIRNVIFDYLEENNGKIRIFEESPIKNSRCDFYTVTDKLTGYEIKSDADSYERLARQIKDYDAFFDENYIIIGRTHRAHVAEKVPPYWGIICITDEEDGFTAEQYARFTAAVKGFENAGLKPKICHCCNSAALCLDKEKHLDMCRPGIILYGLTPAYGLKLKEDFMPVMTVKSVVSMVKKIKKGTTVSYGRTFKAPYDMTVATVTAGYADGYPRLLSSKGQVIIHGRRANIIGRICMDQMSVDVSGIENVKQGDEVILFGKELPVEELAEKCGTINYEIVCGITNRVPRISV